MRKVCFITTVSTTLLTFVNETAKYLYENSDIEIFFVCNPDSTILEKIPKFVSYTPIKMKRGFDLLGIRAFIQLYYLFKNEEFDLVQYATPNASFYSSIASYIANIKIRHYCQWGIRYVGMTHFRRVIYKTIEWLTCYFSTDIKSVSKLNMEYAVSEGLYTRTKASVLGKGGTIGVDLVKYDITNKDKFRKNIRFEFGIKRSFVFGFVGRLTKDKGVNELFMAFKEISEEYDVKLIIVGEHVFSKDVDNNLILWANASNNVVFTGRVSDIELPKYYSAFDVLVHPTYREGFGMVIQEAASMENIIITSDIPGASEVMEKGISCLLVKAKSYKELKNVMIKILNDKDKRYLQMGKNARKRVLKYFDRKVMLKMQYIDYKKLLNI